MALQYIITLKMSSSYYYYSLCFICLSYTGYLIDWLPFN